MNAPGERSLRVGHGLFDPLSGDLSLDGRTVRLRPRTAAVLSHLVMHGDRPVGKEELLHAVWPDVVVTEDSLVQCVKEIRQALGEAGRDWIRTLPRQGYAFVARQPEPSGRAASQPAPLALPVDAPTPPGGMWARGRPSGAYAGIALGSAFVFVFVIVGALATQEWRKGEPATPPAPALSIVVMPLVNATGDPGHENVADDLTESLADGLARTSGVAVIAPRTAFTFKGNPIDVRQIGKLLNVRYVLEGSLRVDGSRPVLTMRLADASSAVQLWSEDFVPETMPEMRALVTGRVASTLGVQLLRADAWADRNRAIPPQALDLLSRARAELRWSGKGAQATAQVRGLLEEAVREHEPFAEAWALLANTYLNDVRFSPTREDDLRRASAAAQRAVALQPDSDWVRFVEGRLQYEQRHMPQALAAFERAAQLNPNNVSALGYRGAALVMLGRPDEALLQIEQAIRLSPRDPQLPAWEMFGGVAHLHLGHDAQAVEWLERSVRAYPSSPFGRLFLAGALGATGRIPEAKAQMEQLQLLRPGFTLGRFRSLEPSDAVAFRAQRERLYEGLRRAGMPD